MRLAGRVLDDFEQFRALEYPQREVDDNGRMLLSSRYLAPRGWRSPEVITRAKRELLEAQLIFETVKGSRPNKASWYAVTWHNCLAEAFSRARTAPRGRGRVEGVGQRH